MSCVTIDQGRPLGGAYQHSVWIHPLEIKMTQPHQSNFLRFRISNSLRGGVEVNAAVMAFRTKMAGRLSRIAPPQTISA